MKTHSEEANGKTRAMISAAKKQTGMKPVYPKEA
jgi:hypothetical protein